MSNVNIKIKLIAKTKVEADLIKMIIHIYNVTGSNYLKKYMKDGLEKAFHRLLCDKDIFTIKVIKVFEEGEKSGGN